MNGSIIQTALTGKTLRLELDYRKPSPSKNDCAGTERPATYVEVGFDRTDSPLADEFALLLSVI